MSEQWDDRLDTTRITKHFAFIINCIWVEQRPAPTLRSAFIDSRARYRHFVYAAILSPSARQHSKAHHRLTRQT